MGGKHGVSSIFNRISESYRGFGKWTPISSGPQTSPASRRSWNPNRSVRTERLEIRKIHLRRAPARARRPRDRDLSRARVQSGQERIGVRLSPNCPGCTATDLAGMAPRLRDRDSCRDTHRDPAHVRSRCRRPRFPNRRPPRNRWGFFVAEITDELPLATSRKRQCSTSRTIHTQSPRENWTIPVAHKSSD